MREGRNRCPHCGWAFSISDEGCERCKPNLKYRKFVYGSGKVLLFLLAIGAVTSVFTPGGETAVAESTTKPAVLRGASYSVGSDDEKSDQLTNSQPTEANSGKTDSPKTPDLELKVSHWGDYEAGGWTWKIFLIPKNITVDEFITAAERTFKKYPHTRSRFFDDAEKLQQYVDAARFLWDGTGTVPRTEFPTEWRKRHQIGIINDRSPASYGRWRVMYRKGGVDEHLVFLE